MKKENPKRNRLTQVVRFTCKNGRETEEVVIEVSKYTVASSTHANSVIN